jgi:hypothetical protein
VKHHPQHLLLHLNLSLNRNPTIPSLATDDRFALLEIGGKPLDGPPLPLEIERYLINRHQAMTWMRNRIHLR